MKKTNLSIYLIKEKIIQFDEILEKGEILNKYNSEFITYYQKTRERTPEWVKTFFEKDYEQLKVRNASVLGLLKRKMVDGKDRIFAITFGYGKSFLQDDVIEEQFGIKVVLNSVARNKIRKISKVDLSKNYKQSQEQLPNENDISEFGFDANSDLVKCVSGKSEDIFFEKSMLTGGDGLSFATSKKINDLNEIVDYVYSIYLSDNYKKEYPWLDNIKQVKDKKIIKKLNDLCVNYINENKFNDVWLAIPEIILWDKIKGIHISGTDKEIINSDIIMSIFMSSFLNEKIENYNQLKRKSIHLISSENNEIYKKWSAYKCIVGNIEYENKSYSINGGTWYQIDKDFKEDIDKEFNSINLFSEKFADFPIGVQEDDYNKLLSEKLIGSAFIHGTNISYGGGRGNKIELCDILYKNNFIHIKKNRGSSDLSHLFNQAVISSSLMKDEKFRKKCNEKFKEKNIHFSFPDNFESHEYNVVIGIINKSGDDKTRPKIPFFSKVSLKYAKEKIYRDLGYGFYIKNIYNPEKK